MLLGHLDAFLPEASVTVFEDPAIISRREIEKVTDIACLAKVVPARYHQDLECVEVATGLFDAGSVAAVVPGVEYAVHAAAALADTWGLPGATREAAAILTDKLRLRQAACAGGLRNPEWTQVGSADDVRAFAGDGPVVLKPANRHASLGVQVLAPGDDLDAAWAVTVAARDDMMLPDRPLAWRYMAERVLRGHEYSAEVIVSNGEIHFENVTAKITAAGRYPVELGHVVPAPLDPRQRTAFSEAMAALVAAVGFRDGILHAEWMLDDDGPVLIECAGRIPGDGILDLIDTAYSCHLVREMVAALSGRTPDLPASPGRASAIRFVNAAAGEVTAVTGLDEARAARGVIAATATVSPGARVGELRSSWDRVGQVMALGPTPQIAAERVEQAAALIDVVTVPAGQ